MVNFNYDQEFFDHCRNFIYFCRPIYSENFDALGIDQTALLIGTEQYFKINYKENIRTMQGFVSQFKEVPT